MKKILTGIVCLLLVGCGEDQDITVFKNKHLEGTNTSKTIGTLLDNRPMCKNSEIIKVNELYRYSCDLSGYENLVKEIIVKRAADLERENNKLINQYKEEIEVAEFKLEQLTNVENAFEELEINDVIEKYNDLFNNFTLPLNKVDPIGTAEYSEFIFDSLDYILQDDKRLTINLIKGVAIKHGVTAEFHAHVNLLEQSKEKRKEVFDSERKLIIQYADLAKGELNNIKSELTKKLEFLAKFTYDPFFKQLTHNVTFKSSGKNVQVEQCNIEYSAYDNEKYTMTVDGFCNEILYDNTLYEKDIPALLEIMTLKILQEKNM